MKPVPKKIFTRVGGVPHIFKKIDHMKRPLLIILLVCLFFPVMAQDEAPGKLSANIFEKIQSKSQGKIRFQQDSLIQDLVFRHMIQNQQNPKINGYRIRIYSDLGTHARKESEEYKARFYENFRDIPIYQNYDRPYWKVYVGDFRTKIEAIKSLKKVKREFPAAFIVPDQINLPELDE